MNAAHTAPSLFADLALARRLERAEGSANADFVETRAKLFPDSGARWIEVAGARAMFDGVSSPITQTFGLGLFDKVTSDDLDTIEEFFQSRGAPVFHEVSPLADHSFVILLNQRGYQPFEFTSVLYRPIQRNLTLPAPHNEKVRARLIEETERDLWGRTAAEGWKEFVEVADLLQDLTRVSAAVPGMHAFLAELDGRAIGAGGLRLCDGVALLAGASTIPTARKQGSQLALLEARLRHGAEQGCDIAMMGAWPGTASQRNAERHGFRIAYTRIKWRLPLAG